MRDKNDTRSIEEMQASVWAALDRMEEQREKDRAETKESQKKTDEQIKKMSIELGKFGNNLGSFAESYFFTSFEEGKTDFFGEKFDEIRKNVRKTDDEELSVKDEYDILFMNGKSIGIIEVKYKAHINDIPAVLQKVETFRINFPKFKNHKIYLGLASLSFYDELEAECQKYGIAIIKQIGDTIIMNEENIKAY